MNLGEKLIELRVNMELSQYEVATRLGIKRPRYNAWEQGISKPRYDMIEKLASFFDVSPDELMGYPDNKNTPEWATNKDKLDLKRILEEDGPIMFDGVVIDESDREKIKMIMEAMFWDEKAKKNKRNNKK